MLENQEKWAENTLFNATSILTSKCYEELMGRLVVDWKQKIHDSFGDTKQRINDTKDSSLGHTRWLSATTRCIVKHSRFCIVRQNRDKCKQNAWQNNLSEEVTKLLFQ